MVLARLPKAELHLHLEGAVPWPMVRARAADPLPERPAWWDRAHRFAGFGDFLAVMRPLWRPILNAPEDVAEAARGIFAGLCAQSVRYVEISFGLGAYAFPVFEIARAIKGAAPSGMTVKVIAGISRDRDLETMHSLAREAIGCDEVDGIDLHGDERVGHLQDFAGLYAQARERGMIAKAHAGELGGADAVRETVRALKVTRIEHGIGAARAPEVVGFLRDAGVVLDVCPWSNVKLGVSPDLRTHPLIALHKAGVRVTVNTDDPTVFGQTLSDEYDGLLTEMGLSAADVETIAANGFRAADLPEGEKAAAIAEIAAVCREESCHGYRG